MKAGGKPSRCEELNEEDQRIPVLSIIGQACQKHFVDLRKGPHSFSSVLKEGNEKKEQERGEEAQAPLFLRGTSRTTTRNEALSAYWLLAAKARRLRKQSKKNSLSGRKRAILREKYGPPLFFLSHGSRQTVWISKWPIVVSFFPAECASLLSCLLRFETTRSGLFSTDE